MRKAPEKKTSENPPRGKKTWLCNKAESRAQLQICTSSRRLKGKNTFAMATECMTDLPDAYWPPYVCEAHGLSSCYVAMSRAQGRKSVFKIGGILRKYVPQKTIF